MTVNLMEASQQWAKRPPDERFWTPEDLLAFVAKLRVYSQEAPITLSIARAFAQDNNLALDIGDNRVATFTNYGFDQVCQLTNTPSDFVRQLPASVAADCINARFSSQSEAGIQRVALYRGSEAGDVKLASLTSEKYSRIWDEEIATRLVALQDRGWVVPPARPVGASGVSTRIATEADCLRSAHAGLGIKPGDIIGPSGLYASDRDMFAFFVNEDRVIELNGVNLYRGFFAYNTEVVRGRSFKITYFLYNSVCGNHIVWDARNVKEVRVVHRGENLKAEAKALSLMESELTEYADSADDSDLLRKASEAVIGPDQQSVVDVLYGKAILTKKLLKAAYNAAADHPEDGHKGPNTIWGMVNGLTRISRDFIYANERDLVDRAASQVLDLAKSTTTH